MDTFARLCLLGGMLLSASSCCQNKVPASQSKAPTAKPKGAPDATTPDVGARTRAKGASSELNRDSAIGTNIASAVDWNTEMPFVDLFKSSREWVSGTKGGAWSDGRPLDLDENGWVRSLKPKQVARTLMPTHVKRPGGLFVVLYDGEGEIQFAYGLEEVPGESRPGRYLIKATKNPSFDFDIIKTNPRNPIRNIRVLAAGGSCEKDDGRWCDASHPCPGSACIPFEETYREKIFHPKFLATMGRYSVLRFMEWLGTNDSTISKWSERPKLTDARWSEKGVPIEVMVSLSKRLRAEPWFTIPHRADSDYITKFASLVRETLPEEFRVWVEHSNEVWNPQFAQYREVAACQAGKNEDNEFGAALVCHAERSDAIFRAWREVFGESRSRVIRVLASQSGNVWVAEQLLRHRDLHERVDALAIAPYFGLIANEDNEAEIAAMSLDQLIARTERDVLPEAISQMQQHAELAKRFGLSLVAYEGGQHFVAIGYAVDNERINSLYDALNRDPRIKDLYTHYLTAWRRAGGQLFVNYTHCDAYSKWGRWGLLEYVDQPPAEAPKFEAIMQFIQQNPRWW
jgi:hypothetical protein